MLGDVQDWKGWKAAFEKLGCILFCVLGRMASYELPDILFGDTGKRVNNNDTNLQTAGLVVVASVRGLGQRRTRHGSHAEVWTCR